MLQSLAWLVGSWHEDVAGNVMATEWNWSDNGNFLISEFSVQQSADISWTGTHRVGWDAEWKQFRSWIFESNGGSAGGWWRPNEDGSWSIHLSGVDADGVRRLFTLIYLPDGEDAIVVTQDQRIVGGRACRGRCIGSYVSLPLWRFPRRSDRGPGVGVFGQVT